jgi:hypothetical protein
VIELFSLFTKLLANGAGKLDPTEGATDISCCQKALDTRIVKSVIAEQSCGFLPFGDGILTDWAIVRSDSHA